ncbi:hypothetical protein pdam_00025163 [Pocillopora damicornis]|uniref:G-protein coupled receptors family 1 profile domain-containing protein n=1 Tax=Pocillopora damicornis TaxID=46731 RepID=A0A3M6UMC0_POCDA|nr:hypothetical protein pdam_00025163 [Pocillopora damicornis]
MSTTKFTSGGTQTKTFEELLGTLRLQRFTVGEVSSSCLFCTILHSKTHSSHQIREERQAMKETIRQALFAVHGVRPSYSQRSNTAHARRFQLDEIFLVARTEETNAELCRQQISPEVEHCRKHLKNCYAPPLWWVGFNQHLSHQSTFSSPSQHFLAILYPCCPSQGICPPCAVQTLDRCLIFWLPLYVTFWMSVVHEHWTLCYYAETAAYIIGSALCGVSLLTMAVISVDRLLRALLAGLRYKEIVTLNSVCIIIANFWVLCLVASLCAIFDRRIITLCAQILIPLLLLISLASYTKIFRTLRNHQAQEQDHVQQQPNHPSALNMARYRKAVYSALWVQSVLVVCYTPYLIVRIVLTYSTTYSSQLGVVLAMDFSLTRRKENVKTSNEANNQTSTLLSMELDHLTHSSQTLCMHVFWKE